LKQVTESARFEEDLGLEKGDVVVLIMATLKKYGLSLSYVEARKMTTSGEVIDYIESQVCQEALEEYCSSSNEEQ
jgi:acyl carrier protein